MFYSELVPISKFLHSYPLKKLTFMLKKQTIWKQERKIASSFLRSFFCLKPGPYQPRKHKHKRSLCASEDGHDINIRISKPCILLMFMFMSPQCPVSRGHVGVSISARLSANWRRLMLTSTMFSLNISIIRSIRKNRSALRTWGLMPSFIPFGWNAVLKYQYLGVYLQQVRRQTRGKYMAEYGLLYLHLYKGLLLKAFEQEGYISAIPHYGHNNQRANFWK